MATDTTTRADIQAKRIRVAVAMSDMSLRQLHGRLIDEGGYIGVYETFRKQMKGEGRELSYGNLVAIADITDSPLEWVAGNDGAEWAKLLRGVYVSPDLLDLLKVPA